MEKEGKNFVEKYVDWVSEFTDAPPVFQYYIAYWCVSTIMGHRAYLKQGYKSFYPNIWMVVIGESSWSRKSTSIDIGRSLVEKVEPGMIYPDEFSHESMIKMLSEKPQGSFIYNEFRSFMKLMDRDFMSNTKSVLTHLYDCPESYTRKIGIKEEKVYNIYNPVINVLSGTTIDWFTDTVKDKDLLSGFIPRFLFVTSPRQERFMAMQPAANMKMRDELVDQLGAFANCQGEARFAPDALKLQIKNAEAFFAKHSGNGSLCTPFYPRLQSYNLKFSLLNSIIYGNFPTITEDDVDLAWHNTQELAGSMRSIIETEMTFTYDESKRKRVMDYLKSKAPEAISWSEIMRYTRYRAKELQEITTSLHHSDLIDIIAGEDDAMGRPRKSLKWKDPAHRGKA